MRLVSMSVHDGAGCDVLLMSACLLLLALSRSVRNLRTCIGDEPHLGNDLCRIFKGQTSQHLQARLSAVVSPIPMSASPVEQV